LTATTAASSEPDSEPASAEAIDNRVFVLILQHPQERRERAPRATAAAAAAVLRRARLVIGLSWPNLSRALGRRGDPQRWGVLYLGSVRPQALATALPTATPPREIIVLGRDGAPIADPRAILSGLAGIVLLDGTWSQAKTLWWRNPWLLKLHRLVLNPPRPGQLGRLRREPRREALSTLEAAALALRHLEAGPAAAEALLAALDRLIAAVRRPTPTPVPAPAPAHPDVKA
jgi:DTW domain-containing protein